MKFDYCDVLKITNDEFINTYKLINDIKKEKIKQYYRTIDKKNTIAGELLVRKMISKSLNINPEKIKFGIMPSGKPYVIGFNIEFNISHSDNVVVCAISNNKIGIDIEKIRPINLSIAKKICNEEELKYIFNHIPLKNELVYTKEKSILTRFFEIWTNKEAFIKCKGKNISSIKQTHPKNVKSFNLLDKYIISIYEDIN